MIRMLKTTAPTELVDPESRTNTRSPTPTDQAVGAKIRILRRAAGMTLRELGDAVGVSFVQFQRYETGASRISTSRLVAISEALCVRIDSLVSETSPAEPEPMSGRQRNESGELVRLFKLVSDPRQRLAIIALVSAMAERDKRDRTLPGGFRQVLSAPSNGALEEIEQ